LNIIRILLINSFMVNFELPVRIRNHIINLISIDELVKVIRIKFSLLQVINC